MKNECIRILAQQEGVKLWQIADKLGINDGNFSRKLRRELSKEENEKIIGIIAELKGGGDNGTIDEHNNGDL